MKKLVTKVALQLISNTATGFCLAAGGAIFKHIHTKTGILKVPDVKTEVK